MKVTTILLAALLILISMGAPTGLQADEKALAEKQKIETLIKHIENLKDATFVRNGSSYDAKMAARFLRGKWDAQQKEVRTAMDFIDKVASVSSTSRKPYLIRFRDARELKCGEYLKVELKKLEQTKAGPD